MILLITDSIRHVTLFSAEKLQVDKLKLEIANHDTVQLFQCAYSVTQPMNQPSLLPLFSSVTSSLIALIFVLKEIIFFFKLQVFMASHV